MKKIKLKNILAIIMTFMLPVNGVAEIIYLNCFVNDDVYELDIDNVKSSGRWSPYSTNIFKENSKDPQYRLNISINNVALFGKKPFDYIEVDLNTLSANANISLSGGMDGDSLSGGMESNYCVRLSLR